jgi:hypothetical protein
MGARDLWAACLWSLKLASSRDQLDPKAGSSTGLRTSEAGETIQNRRADPTLRFINRKVGWCCMRAGPRTPALAVRVAGGAQMWPLNSSIGREWESPGRSASRAIVHGSFNKPRARVFTFTDMPKDS